MNKLTFSVIVLNSGTKLLIYFYPTSKFQEDFINKYTTP